MRDAVTIEINGRMYPLCLTVAAMDELEAAGYQLSDISRLLGAGVDMTLEQLAKNCVWLAAILIREGELNRQLCANDSSEGRYVLTVDELSHILTPAAALALRAPLMESTAASLTQSIQADHKASEKNGAGAAQV